MNKQEKARWLSKLYAAVAEGKTLQHKDASLRWCDHSTGPDFFVDPDLWRIKPEPRECVRSVKYLDDYETCGVYHEAWVKVPDDWPEGTKVRVTEILE